MRGSCTDLAELDPLEFFDDIGNSTNTDMPVAASEFGDAAFRGEK